MEQCNKCHEHNADIDDLCHLCSNLANKVLGILDDAKKNPVLINNQKKKEDKHRPLRANLKDTWTVKCSKGGKFYINNKILNDTHRSFTFTDRTIENEFEIIENIIYECQIKYLTDDELIKNFPDYNSSDKSIFDDVYIICPKKKQRSLLAFEFNTKELHKPRFCNSYVLAISHEKIRKINLFYTYDQNLYTDPMIYEYNKIFQIDQVNNKKSKISLKLDVMYDVLHDYNRLAHCSFETTFNDKLILDSQALTVKLQKDIMKIMGGIIVNMFIKDNLLTIKNSNVNPYDKDKQYTSLEPISSISICPAREYRFSENIVQKYSSTGTLEPGEHMTNIVMVYEAGMITIYNYLDYKYEFLLFVKDELCESITK